MKGFTFILFFALSSNALALNCKEAKKGTIDKYLCQVEATLLTCDIHASLSPVMPWEQTGCYIFTKDFLITSYSSLNPSDKKRVQAMHAKMLAVEQTLSKLEPAVPSSDRIGTARNERIMYTGSVKLAEAREQNNLLKLELELE